MLTEALLAEGKYPDALKEVEFSVPLAVKSQNRLTHLQFDLATARAGLFSDHPRSSRPQLEHILQEAGAHGFLGVEFEARLAKAEFEIRLGHRSEARAQLVILEKAARAKGFGSIARKAVGVVGKIT